VGHLAPHAGHRTGDVGVIKAYCEVAAL